MTLRDAGIRTRAERETASSLLIEASAGTGKTTTLIRRIVRLVVDDAVPLRQVAAMTFTEKAAGEMKTRLREELDRILHGDGNEERKSVARRAVFDLDAAEVSTIHAFCARLLRERPVEAGVDPDFVAGDELLAADLAEEAFRGWFDRAARRDGPVLEALRAGVSPEALRDLALALYGERLLLAGATLPRDAGDEIRQLAARLAGTYEALLPLLPPKKDDKKRPRVDAVVANLRILAGSSDAALEVAEPDIAIDLHGRWPEEAGAAVKASRADVAWLHALVASLRFVPVLTALVDEIRSGFFAEIAKAKWREGVLDFDDLLLSARNLLRTSRAAREHFHAKYRTLVVDEFQDTDPVQAEIVIRLAAAPVPQDGAWVDLVPEPGRLFLVGDPKQSIYRFRRADIETYRDAAGRLPAGERLLLSCNFRSTQPLLDFVNEVGPGLLPPPAGRKYAVGYAPLEPSDRTKAGTRPAVLFLAPPDPEADADAPVQSDDAADESAAERAEELKVQAQEARAVANLLLSPRFSGGEKPWSRIAILVPRHATIEFLEDAFRDAGIPFVLEGGRSFYRREEVAAVVEALKAIDDPSDAVAVVAALKSILFGVSDRVLLDAAEAGVRFGEPATVPESSPLFQAVRLFARLHSERHGRGVAATLSDLFASRQTFAAVENGAVVNPVQGLANLERLLSFAHGLDREGLSFREAVARLVRRTQDDAPEPGAFTEEIDAVRLMTLHRAKGLEFDVVVLADLGLRETKPRRKASVVCERAGGRFGVRLGLGGGTVGSARLSEVEAEEKVRLEAELRRLLYVGLTRAKEALVISWFRRRKVKRNGDVSDGLDKSFLAPLAPVEAPSARLAPLVEVVKADLSKPAEAPREPGAETTVDLPAALREAEERLERVRKTSSRPLRRAGEKEASFVPASEDTEWADRDDAPDRARRIGVAVHEAMERLLGAAAPRDGASTDSALDAAFVELSEDEKAEAASLVEALLANPITRRALSSKHRFVEMPLLYRDASLPESPLVEGKIDLLFEESDGWQIVDWKTDRLAGAAARAEREALYAPQLRAYEEGLRKVLGPGARVKPGLLVFARLAGEAVGPGLAPP